MTALRRQLLRHRLLAACIVLTALLMKALVPGGFMPVFNDAGVTIALCTGVGPQAMAAPMPGMSDHGKSKTDHGAREVPCGFGGLASASLAAADPVLLTLAIAFIMATVFRADPRSIAPPIEHLRPPLRGPPAA